MKRLLLLLLGVVLVAAACGGDDGDTATAAPAVVVENPGSGSTDPVETEPTDDASTATDGTAETLEVAADATDEELALAFADCMRGEGIDFPDPVVAADGSVTLVEVDDPNDLPFDPNDPAFDAAADVCGDLLGGASFLPGDDDLTELQDDLLVFADCLRDLGFDVDDPDISGGPGSVNP
ncbi:MAG: hypothetical protein AAF081_20125, partial [Actinomycetota bacterium]